MDPLKPNSQVSSSDAFEQFAEGCGLRLTAEPLCVAPQDVLDPVESVEQHFLVSISRAGSKAPPVRLVFLKPVTDRDTPSMREVLWWMAGDAWVLERANQELDTWAATYGYPAEAEATAWLYEQARRQAGGLARLLGDENMRALMELYEAQVGPSRAG